MKPLSAESYDVQFTMGRGAHDKLQYAQELLSHQVPSGDVAEIFERALDALIEVARGGEATVDGLRLRCRAHNQYAAECTFGAEFMRHKRIAAAAARAT